MSIRIVTKNMTQTPTNSNSSDRLDRIEVILERFIEQSDRNITQLAREQTITNQVLRQLIETQIETDKAINKMVEIQASLAAEQEKQERLLEYLIRRLEVGNG
ncbi:hypothetical protein ACE1CI_37080 [Aerosakkonemataceae cyanobacterium BLCC-F50]|uniref:Uncharacterized protein n=3 Tax=Floridanema TaxID=3396149 RepID=A0ABV4Y3P9_9CYAN